jgi:hypothetical protein
MSGRSSAKHRRIIGNRRRCDMTVSASEREFRCQDLTGMAPAELLAAAGVAGLTVFADGVRLVVRGPKNAEADLIRTVLARKGELMPLLGPMDHPARTADAPTLAPTRETVGQQPAGPTGPAPWDRAEADRLLTYLRQELARIEWQRFGGRFPPLLARLLATGRTVAGGYVRDHELELRRGWDPMQLLREVVEWLLRQARAGLPGDKTA